MKLLGSTAVRGFYPVENREEAVLVVQKNIFLYSDGPAGSAVYLYQNEEQAFECKNWVVECKAVLKNAAEISILTGEFDTLFRYGMPKSVEYSEKQRKVVLWSGYDGFILDCGLIAIYGNINSLCAIKAYPIIKDRFREPSYNTIWSKIKKLSGLFKRDSSSG